MKTCNIEDKTGWVFVIDIDQFAQQYFSVEESASFYQNNVTFLKKFQCEDQTVGNCITNKVVSILRRMGYQETISKVLYPADAFKKMNMIQEEWDKNNQAYPLVDKLGDFTVARTTLTYAVEDIMSLNYQSGVSDLRIFEVTHSYFPKVDQVLPDEKLTVAIGSYGPDVTMESFTKEVRNFLTAMGIENVKFVPTNMAIAYKWNECMIIMHNDEYLHSNFGRINEKAAKNFNIGVPAYHAHFDLAALTEATKGN
jgi:phenylalanyl-tRNA synthetase beta subunit